MNNAVFGKTIKNMRKHRDIKLGTNEARRNRLAPGPNYHKIKYFWEKLLVIEIKKRKDP